MLCHNDFIIKIKVTQDMDLLRALNAKKRQDVAKMKGIWNIEF